MEKLIEKLKEFNENINGESKFDDIQKSFEELAPVFLYSGYINVRDDFKIYIRTVEFYFHSEKYNGVHDPIVYHRNGRDLEQAPYFPFMSIHAHNSGFDITFEKSGEYRASALIRTYEVKDKNGEYLVWNKAKKKFEKSKEYHYNYQSTYLYALLNGFAFGNNNDISWEEESKDVKKVLGKPRQNVFKSESEWEYINTKKEKCDRKWSFTREEQI
ncbi:MAG: hypothetical protein IJU33_02800 [Bacteroidales bacterium]|nr:hypothetical protein [Bacteroidales bacterium]